MTNFDRLIETETGAVLVALVAFALLVGLLYVLVNVIGINLFVIMALAMPLAIVAVSIWETIDEFRN